MKDSFKADFQIECAWKHWKVNLKTLCKLSKHDFTAKYTDILLSNRGRLAGQKKRTYECSYVRLYVLPNSYVLQNLYVRSYVLPNLHVRSSVLPNSNVCPYLRL